MGHSHAAPATLENPGTLRGSSAVNLIFWICAIIGIVAFAIGYSSDHARAWSSLLRGHFYFLAIAMGGLFFVAIQFLTTSMWSSPVRRIAESFTAYLPFVFVSTIGVFLGAHDLFHWTHLEAVANDPILKGKSGYLNMTFFVIRTVVAVGGWLFFAKKLVGASLSTDQGASYKEVYFSNRKFGIAFLVFFAFSFSMAAFDQLMSLDAHWFSTMFGVYIFAGAYQSFFAMFSIFVIILRRQGYLKNFVNENHIHDIAKLMFAFTVFWAYTGFSQYMLIWYANLPEETGYFLLRFNQGWEFWSIALFVGKFVMPFLALLPRGNKRCEELVFLTAVWILIMQYMDLNWIIQPQFLKDGPSFGFVEIGTWLGFFGVFGLLVTRFLKRHDLVAMKDPYLQDSVFHHHV